MPSFQAFTMISMSHMFFTGRRAKLGGNRVEIHWGNCLLSVIRRVVCMKMIAGLVLDTEASRSATDPRRQIEYPLYLKRSHIVSHLHIRVSFVLLFPPSSLFEYGMVYSNIIEDGVTWCMLRRHRDCVVGKHSANVLAHRDQSGSTLDHATTNDVPRWRCAFHP